MANRSRLNSTIEIAFSKRSGVRRIEQCRTGLLVTRRSWPSADAAMRVYVSLQCSRSIAQANFRQAPPPANPVAAISTATAIHLPAARPKICPHAPPPAPRMGFVMTRPRAPQRCPLCPSAGPPHAARAGHRRPGYAARASPGGVVAASFAPTMGLPRCIATDALLAASCIDLLLKCEYRIVTLGSL